MRTILFFLLVLIMSQSCANKTDFDKYFTDQSMRVDFFFYGNADQEEIRLDKITKEPYWGGTKTKMVSSLEYGEYKFELIDLKFYTFFH